MPGSGKSVVSQALMKLMSKKRIHAQLLSSDELRKVLTPKPDYSLEERDIVYRTLVYIAHLLTANGTNVIIDATGNLRSYRDEARRQIPKFTEVYLECPLEVCMEREVKRANTHNAPRRIYSKAFEGKAPNVPGVGQPYEPPLRPEVTINTITSSPMEGARQIVKKLLP